MGKSLKGRELGVGISQRADGLYTARFTDHSGKRRQKYFKKLQDCRRWLADIQFQDEHGNVLFSSSPTVSAWFWYWLDTIKGGCIRPQTRIAYSSGYRTSIQPYIGEMLLTDVRQVHCQHLLSQKLETHELSSVKNTRALLWAIFNSACENGLVDRNPVTKSIHLKKDKKRERTTVLTLDEQKRLLSSLRGNDFYYPFAFVLQTGLRVSELSGLKWGDVDWENRVLHVRRSLWWDGKNKTWKDVPTKTEAGARDIPLTMEAVGILKSVKLARTARSVIRLEYADYIFLSKKGIPRNRAAYDHGLYDYCEKCGVPKVSIHVLRHTFATRCIEAGMKPKTLQTLLGHSGIQTTLDLYVHVTDDEKRLEMARVEDSLKFG